VIARELPDAADRAARRASHDTYAPYELRPAARRYQPSVESRILSLGWRAFVALCLAFVAIGSVVLYWNHAVGAVR
jgi:hypothetical protein